MIKPIFQAILKMIKFQEKVLQHLLMDANIRVTGLMGLWKDMESNLVLMATIIKVNISKISVMEKVI